MTSVALTAPFLGSSLKSFGVTAMTQFQRPRISMLSGAWMSWGSRRPHHRCCLAAGMSKSPSPPKETLDSKYGSIAGEARENGGTYPTDASASYNSVQRDSGSAGAVRLCDLRVRWKTETPQD